MQHTAYVYYERHLMLHNYSFEWLFSIFLFGSCLHRQFAPIWNQMHIFLSWHQSCRWRTQGYRNCWEWDAWHDGNAKSVRTIQTTQRSSHCWLSAHDSSDCSAYRDSERAWSRGLSSRTRFQLCHVAVCRAIIGNLNVSCRCNGQAATYSPPTMLLPPLSLLLVSQFSRGRERPMRNMYGA